jgi:hypothetical protein
MFDAFRTWHLAPGTWAARQATAPAWAEDIGPPFL